jgi:hypothetical protein
MLRDNVINFLEATIVLLGLTNVVSIVVAGYAIALARGVDGAISAGAGRDAVLVLLSRWMRTNRWTQRVRR